LIDTVDQIIGGLAVILSSSGPRERIYFPTLSAQLFGANQDRLPSHCRAYWWRQHTRRGSLQQEMSSIWS